MFAVDQSSSIDTGSAELLLQGHVEALKSAEVAAAIRSGPLGCIAISYVEWSSVGRLNIVLPWTRLCSAEDAQGAADQIRQHGSDGRERRGRGRTSLSFAIDASGLLPERCPGHAARTVIDVSANGTNNEGMPVIESRDRASEAVYIINGIAISLEEPGITDDLPGYLYEQVITGPGSFVVAAGTASEYPKTLRRN